MNQTDQKSAQRFPPPGFIITTSHVEGIEVFKPVPQVKKLDKTVDFRCPQCSGETAYSVENGGLTCAYCGYHEAAEVTAVGRRAEKFEFTVETVQRATQGWGIARTELSCKNCGSRISLPEGALTANCPFCNSNKVIHHKAPQDVLRPRFLIPFQIDQTRCHTITREWLGRSWVVPKALRRLAAVDDFTPLFLPFWTFGAGASASWRAQVGHTRTYRDSKGHTRTRTVWRWESGQVNHTFSDLLVRGTNHVSVHLLSQVSEYNLEALVPYDPQFLAGMQAQAYEVELEDAWATARSTMREDVQGMCRSQASTSKIRNFSMQLDFTDERWRYILLPVYINTYYYQNRPFQLLINGQTGRIAGQRPADWRKIAWVAAALMLPGLLLFFGLLLFQESTFYSGGGIGAFLLFALGLIISVVIALQAQRLDDA